MTRARILVAAIALLVGPFVAAQLPPGTASAACSASPPLSPVGFDGTVVRIGLDDRQAFVRKDDGTTVEVDGGNVHSDGMSGEDFHFELGGRYRVEPENSAPPFLVNDCTGTTLLGMTSLPAVGSSSAVAPSSAVAGQGPAASQAAAASQELAASQPPTAKPAPLSSAQPQSTRLSTPFLVAASVAAVAILVTLSATARRNWRRRRIPPAEPAADVDGSR
jgi:hypothetical protein